jgi:hypothetical protein
MEAGVPHPDTSHLTFCIAQCICLCPCYSKACLGGVSLGQRPEKATPKRKKAEKQKKIEKKDRKIIKYTKKAKSQRWEGHDFLASSSGP